MDGAGTGWGIVVVGGYGDVFGFGPVGLFRWRGGSGRVLRCRRLERARREG